MESEKIIKRMKKQGYRIIGEHTAVKICRWTKNSLRDEGFCFKEQFYGIKAHRCCQMTPWLGCPNKCEHCWRAIESNFCESINNNEINSPKEIVDGCIEAQRKLLEGFKILPETKFKTSSKVNMEKWKEAQEPNHFSISLSGEPTLYLQIGKLIEEIRKRGKTSFLVTNGLYPEKIKELAEKKQLPTQLTVTVNTSNEKSYLPFHKSSMKNAWKKLNETLDILSNLNCRTVFRMNLIRNFNMDEKSLKEFAKLIIKSNPKFVHVKGYMSVGFARERLGYNKMPNNSEMEKAVNILAKETGLKLLDKHERSRAYVLGKNKSDMKIKKSEI